MTARFGRFKPFVILLANAVLCGAFSGLASAVTYTPQVLFKLDLPSGFAAPSVLDNGNPIPIASGLVVGSGYELASAQLRPVMWNASVATLLSYSGFVNASVGATGGGQHVGSGFVSPSSNHTHALLWNGTNDPIDMHPAGFSHSSAFATDGTQQVGHGFEQYPISGHALMWNGTNAVTDLHPNGFTDSVAYGVGGGQQVGVGGTGSEKHALLWNGTNEAIDLHPQTGFYHTFAIGAGGGQQVGVGEEFGTGHFHALLWNGTNTVIDLNPIGFSGTSVHSTNGMQQVGYGFSHSATQGEYHALLWNGTNSATDLGALLSDQFFRSSKAFSIDSAGNVYGLAYAWNNGGTYAVAWTVPEPSGMSLFALGAMCFRRRRRLA